MMAEKKSLNKAGLATVSFLVLVGLASLSGFNTTAQSELETSPCPRTGAPVLAEQDLGGFGVCFQIQDEVPVRLVDAQPGAAEMTPYHAQITWDYVGLWSGSQQLVVLDPLSGGDVCFNGSAFLWCVLGQAGDPIHLVEVSPGESVLCRSDVTTTATNPEGAHSFGPVAVLTLCMP